jgi:hypothetical protein
MKDFYNILIEFGMPMKLVRVITTCLNEAYIGVRIDKRLSDRFSIRDDFKHCMFENRALRRIFGLKRNEVTGE